jgi:hypothetical protein
LTAGSAASSIRRDASDDRVGRVASSAFAVRSAGMAPKVTRHRQVDNTNLVSL